MEAEKLANHGGAMLFGAALAIGLLAVMAVT
jgi:hypothetical protein